MRGLIYNLDSEDKESDQSAQVCKLVGSVVHSWCKTGSLRTGFIQQLKH